MLTAFFHNWKEFSPPVQRARNPAGREWRCGRRRESELKIKMKTVQDFFSLALGLFTLYTAMFGLLTDVIQRSTHLMFAMVILFLNAFTRHGDRTSPLTKAISAVLALASLVIFSYTAFNYSDMALSFGKISQFQYLFGILAILLVLEGARRTVGPAITIIAVIFLLYARFGYHIPGFFQHRGYPVSRIITHLYASSAGLFSTPLGTAATIIIMFVIFGSFLDATKGSTFFMDISFALTGKSKGGPAKAAVVSSCLVGMISGSASANVAATGVFTIPLMMKCGYKDYIAGAVEAAASTGSQIMPPIMGAAAFIIAETLGISYGRVAVAAALPALFYFISVFIMVHLEAGRTSLSAMDASELPDIRKTLLNYGHSILPLIVLITLIAFGYSAMYTALFASFSAILISLIRKSTRLSFRRGLEALIKGSRGIITISAACAAAGIISGVISLTGLGLKISQVIVMLSGGHLIIALILTLLTVLFLGMGLPTAPAYILVSVMVVPGSEPDGCIQSCRPSVRLLRRLPVLHHPACCDGRLHRGQHYPEQIRSNRVYRDPLRARRLHRTILLRL